MSTKRPRSDYEPHADSAAIGRPVELVGTPLPRFDGGQTRDDGSYVPVWKQDARDEQGRKRFHGAFTGGFSAGYFNTVGSKEGWAPTSFVSSRSARAAQPEGSTVATATKPRFEQRLEDFMDEEDLADVAKSRILRTQDEFSGLGDSRAFGNESESLTGLFRHASIQDSVGQRLLQKMGWRVGQGIGPKIERSARLADSGEHIASGSDGKTYYFAPQRTELVLFESKYDDHGLGYGKAISIAVSRKASSRGSDDDDDDRSFSLLAGIRNRTGGTTRSKIGTTRNLLQPNSGIGRSTGFGTGVLDDSASDEDPYAMGPKISHARKSGSGKKAKGKSKSGAGQTSKSQSKLSSANRDEQTYADGVRPLPGFILATSRMYSTFRTDPVVIPTGWVSRLSRSQNPSVHATPVGTANPAGKAPFPQMFSVSRANILGEERLPGKSVFDFLTSDARTKLVSKTGRDDLPAAKGEKGPTTGSTSAGWQPTNQEDGSKAWKLLVSDDAMNPVLQFLLKKVPKVDIPVAKSALERVRSSGSWTPYSDDPKKRSRYIAFLEYQISHAGVEVDGEKSVESTQQEQQGGVPQALLDAVEAAQKGGKGLQDFDREMVEFYQAAWVFRQAEGAMADRFRSSGSTQLKIGGGADDSDGNFSSSFSMSQNPALTAAKMGMYGPTTTRTVTLFFPSRLVCKRFGVSVPEHAVSNQQVGAGKKDVRMGESGWGGVNQYSGAGSGYSREEGGGRGGRGGEGGGDSGHAGGSSGGTDRGPKSQAGVDDSAGMDGDLNPLVTRERPAESLFKAVFGDDDDDDDGDEED